jgi:stage II sporulation protein R
MSKVLSLVKKSSEELRRKSIIRLLIIFILLAAITTGMILSTYSENVNEGLSESLIRLHVIANSDSDEDQALKRDVRDSVLEYMKNELKGSKSIEQTKTVIKGRMDKIEQIAANVIKKKGKLYPVKVMLGQYPFPTKVYGDITLPAGNYQSLRIVIGSGSGANWWCVLFPPLCFVDATHGVVPDSMKQKLKDTLTDDEYNLITESENDENIPVKIKFKIVEFFQDSKNKVSAFFSSIF